MILVSCMSSQNDFELFIRQYCRQHKITIERLADQAGIARGTFYNLMKPNGHPKIVHLVQLAHAMKIHHSILLRLKWCGFGLIPVNFEQESTKCVHKFNDASGFIDETIPDGTIVAVGSIFEKSWTIQNVGEQVWNKRYLMCIDEPFLSPYPNQLPATDYELRPLTPLVALPVTAPMETVTITVTFTAPRVAGRYISYWKMVYESGEICFPNGIGLSVSVLVKSFAVSY